MTTGLFINLSGCSLQDAAFCFSSNIAQLDSSKIRIAKVALVVSWCDKTIHFKVNVISRCGFKHRTKKSSLPRLGV